MKNWIEPHLGLWEDHLADHAAAVERTPVELPDIVARYAALVLTTLRGDGAIFLCDNVEGVLDRSRQAALPTVDTG